MSEGSLDESLLPPDLSELLEDLFWDAGDEARSARLGLERLGERGEKGDKLLKGPRSAPRCNFFTTMGKLICEDEGAFRLVKGSLSLGIRRRPRT